ncbi:MAG: 2-hydroxycyclohexanecarboxyl-CoA dehydrogenase [Nocardioidaceae bacterium]|nr:2-hydroxycyclohexanecarboxyl-CoA dehydrogenase [Nocardioidaceae bacterium]
MADRPVALVTGAAQGVGRAISERLARDGFAVAVNDLTLDDRLSDLAEKTGGLAVAGDISGPDTARIIVDQASSSLGPVDVLVANAAAMHMEPFVTADPGPWWHQIDVNLSGHFRLVQAVVPGMRQRGGGRIVVISSGWGVVGHPNATAYAASKAALIALTKGLGRELGPDGILTNAIAPAFIDTTQLQVDADDLGITLEEMKRRYAEQMPTQKLQTPEEIAGTVAFLAGPDSGGVIGQILQPNGGATRTRA